MRHENQTITFLCLLILISLFNGLSVITITTNIEHMRNRVEGGVGGGRVLLQFHGIVETLEENKAPQ